VIQQLFRTCSRALQQQMTFLFMSHLLELSTHAQGNYMVKLMVDAACEALLEESQVHNNNNSTRVLFSTFGHLLAQVCNVEYFRLVSGNKFGSFVTEHVARVIPMFPFREHIMRSLVEHQPHVLRGMVTGRNNKSCFAIRALLKHSTQAPHLRQALALQVKALMQHENNPNRDWRLYGNCCKYAKVAA